MRSMKWTATAAAVLITAVVSGCGSDATSTAAVDQGDCPTTPVSVVVTVDQWGDIVEALGGDCAAVTTIIKGSAADPHDYEPTPADTAKFEGADLVVVNGLDYDHWAEKAVEALDTDPVLIDGGKVVGLEEGDNPHIWYGPDYVDQVGTAITEALQKLSPDAEAYFTTQQESWNTSLQPYRDLIAKIKAGAPGATFAATEPVFDYLAEACGLTNATPKGYQQAAMNESDPAPADIAEFDAVLTSGQIKALVYNTQTEGPTPEQIRTTAEAADVLVVEVTETIPPGTDSFVEWQVQQLEALATALGV